MYHGQTICFLRRPLRWLAWCPRGQLDAANASDDQLPRPLSHERPPRGCLQHLWRLSHQQSKDYCRGFGLASAPLLVSPEDAARILAQSHRHRMSRPPWPRLWLGQATSGREMH